MRDGKSSSRGSAGIWLGLGALLWAGCTGEVRLPGGNGSLDLQDAPGGVPSTTCGNTGLPAASTLRRLTGFEYTNTIRDLFANPSLPRPELTPDEEAFGYDNNADALSVSRLLVEQYQTSAESLAASAMANPSGPLACQTPSNERTCATEIIQRFGRKSFRRPLSATEVSEYAALYDQMRAQFDHKKSLEVVLQAFLQSPHFLYRVELGEQTTDPKVARYTDLEVASRLSYALWGTSPDETLLAAAEAGNLRDRSQVLAQAERMLADPRARGAVGHFYEQWLGVGRLPELSKDTAIFPAFDTALVQSMGEETRRFLDDITWQDGGGFKALLTSTESFVDGRLAQLYGVSGVTGTTFSRHTLPSGQRAGLLTQASLLALYAKRNQTSPVLRGKFVREKLLCQMLPPPPANIVIVPPEPNPNTTGRDRFVEHSTNPACSGCHTLMDPIGFGFENYDGIGAYREQEAGVPIDASGEILSSAELAGGFNGVVDLAQRLAQSQEVPVCFGTQWLRFALGRGETAEDACGQQQLAKRLADNNGDVRELFVGVTQLDGFLYRRIDEASP